MRSIKEIILPKNGIIKSFNDNKFNLILTPRRWGLTSLLIDYINKIPNDKSILFGVSNPTMVRETDRRITHPNCRIQTIHQSGLIGRSFDYIICDNFFNGEWIQKLVLMVPVLNSDGKIILADSGRCLGYRIEYFRNYNKIIKTSLNNG
jgi:hypothetical protein